MPCTSSPYICLHVNEPTQHPINRHCRIRQLLSQYSVNQATKSHLFGRGYVLPYCICLYIPCVETYDCLELVPWNHRSVASRLLRVRHSVFEKELPRQPESVEDVPKIVRLPTVPEH